MRPGGGLRSGLYGLLALAFLAPALVSPAPAEAQAPPVGRAAALALEFPPLVFEPPVARTEEVGPGVPVLFVEDHRLPLVTVFARFRGGYGLFPRDTYAAATALPGLLRNGGTLTLTPDSVDRLAESLALHLSFGTGGETVFSSLNSLRSTLDDGLNLWTDLLVRPRFDSAQVEVWRGREMESVLRRKDDPRRLAFSEFNRIMYGDHPTGWEMAPADLEPERLSPEILRDLHGRIVCADNLILGLTGDLTWDEARLRLERLVAELPPCPGTLPEAPLPSIRREPGIFLIPRDLPQTTVVLAHATGVRQGDGPDYFSSRIGNAILGSSGFSSRLVSRVRTERGYAYSASSLWTTPRESDGLVGAVTQTRSETTVAAVRLILDIMEEMRSQPPRADEVSLAVDQAVNGFVFNFQAPSQVVSRQMLYLSREMPTDWLERYLEGIQGVRPEDVRQVFSRHLDPERMTILVLGNPDAFDEPLEALGPVRIWEVEPGR